MALAIAPMINGGQSSSSKKNTNVFISKLYGTTYSSETFFIIEVDAIDGGGPMPPPPRLAVSLKSLVIRDATCHCNGFD